MSIVSITSNFKVSTDYIDAVIVNSGNNDPDLIFMNTVETAVLSDVSFSSLWQIYGNLRINPARIAAVKQTTEGYVISTMNNHSFTVPAITGTIADVIANSALGGSGGSAAPFVVGEWDMTGAEETAIPVTSISGTLGGTAPNYELTPTAPLAGSVAGSYMALASSTAGVPKIGTGQVFAKVTIPLADPSDNLVGVSFYLFNSSATEQDIATLTNGGTPTNAIWGVGILATTAVFGGVSSSIPYVNNITGTIVGDNTGWVSSDIAYFGYDYDTGNVIVQKNSGTVIQLAPLDLTGCPSEDTLKVMMGAVFLSATPTLLDTPIVFSLGTTDGGKAPFTAIGDAVLPVGAADGLVYEAINSGSFGGVAVTTGDFVQLYDTTTKIIVTQNPLDIASTEATVASHGYRLNALEALPSSVDTLSVQQLTQGTYTFGTTNAASLKQLVLTADNQTFTLSAASGKVCKFLVEVVTNNDYSPNPGHTFTLNNIAFGVIASYGSRFEVFHDPDNSHNNIRIINPTDVSGGNYISLVDANNIDDVLQCHGNYISLDNSSLTEDLATWDLSGPQSTELAKLHDSIVFEMGTSSAFGITSIGGNTFGLAPGEKCLRFRGGIWMKV